MVSKSENVPKPDFICKPSLLRRANFHGFPALPDEILLEIESYFPPVPVTDSAASTSQIIRRETLLSLSEVCQNLRRFFRPYVWRCVEVFSGMRAGARTLNHHVQSGAWKRKPKRDFAKELLRQLSIVTVQDPDLAKYVQIVDIEINDATFRPIFDELGRCFPLFPNLHTVKIITKFSDGHSDVHALTAAKRGFKRRIPYPHIRTAILSRSIYPLLAVCPNLESLTTFDQSSLLFQSIVDLPALQKLSCPLSITNVHVVAKYLPFLQQITISLDYNVYHVVGVSYFTLFTNLRTLILHRDSFGIIGMSVESMKRVILDLPPRHRQNLKEVIFTGSGWNFPTGEEEIFILPDF